jgi:hypothetical protein
VYGLLVTVFSVLRIPSAGWHAFIEPMDLRLLDHQVIQYEGQIELRGASMHLLPHESTVDSFLYYSSEEYRAILPIISAAALVGLLHSYYWGFFLSECLWWWASAVVMFYLVRVFDKRLAVAIVGGALITSSPLAAVHIGAANLHASSSLGLVFITLLLLRNTSNLSVNLSVIFRSSIAFFFSSVVYSYQWFIIPTFIISYLFLRQYIALITSFISFVIYLVFAYLLFFTFTVSGIEIHSHLNDALVVLRPLLPDRIENSEQITLYMIQNLIPNIYTLLIGYLSTLFVMPSFYSFPIFFISLYGFWHGSRQFQVFYVVSIAFAGISGTLRGYPYVIMAAFPFIYTGAGIGLLELLSLYRTLRFKIGILYIPSEKILFFLFLFALISITNLDLIGNYTFARDWFSIKYKPF